MEIWNNYNDFYQISNEGRVRSVDREIKTKKGIRKYKGKILKQYLKDSEYLEVQFYNCGTKEHKFVHKLVAEAFIPNPNNYKVVDHIDGNTKNNKIENLRWCTQQQNNNFDLYKEHQTNNPLKSKIVYQYTLDGKLVKIWPSTMEAERNGFDSSKISKCCRGIQKTHKGYKWSYIPL